MLSINYNYILFFIFIQLLDIKKEPEEIIFDKIINTEVNNLIIITIFFSILYILKNISNYVRNYLIIYLNQKIDISIILSTFSNIILLPFTFYQGKTSGEVLSRINDLSHFKIFISRIIVTIFLDIIVFITSFIIIYFIKREFIMLIIIMLIVYILIILIFNSQRNRWIFDLAAEKRII